MLDLTHDKSRYLEGWPILQTKRSWKMDGGQEWSRKEERIRRESKSVWHSTQSRARLLWERWIFCGPRCVGPFEIVTTDGHTSQSSSSVTRYCTMIIHRLGAASLSLWLQLCAIVSPRINLIAATLRSSACRLRYPRSVAWY